MAVAPPLSKSLPDLVTALDELDGLDDLPDRPPSPPYAPLPVNVASLDQLAESWSLRHRRPHEVDSVHGESVDPSSTLQRQALRAEGRERGGSTDNDGDVSGRERSPSIGSIHSAPELAGPPSPRDTSPDRGGHDVRNPFSPSPPDSPSLSKGADRRIRAAPSSSTLWDYLREEIFSVEIDGEEGAKSERVTNFLAVPRELEKIIVFGSFVCLDSFLYTFTILPLRALIALRHLVANSLFNQMQSRRLGRPKRRLRLSHKCDLTKAAILIGTLSILHHITDASKMYHGVRGQDTVKLYVLFNVLEIADRLCCSFGQDLQDSLFSRHTFARRDDGSHPHVRPLVLFGLNLAYVVAHTLVLFYQLVTLNVAINSYSNAILTLLMSNQFVEIKGSVFKKFEKENLFQLTCADIVERFQLGIMLFVIALRNLIFEISSAATSTGPPLTLPNVALWLQAIPTVAMLKAIFSPAVIVLLSECLVDWLKHAFITKFNHLRPGVYGRFIDVLCKDLVAGGSRAISDERGQAYVDQSPYVARRLGFAALPLGCLVVRIISQACEMLVDEGAGEDTFPMLVRIPGANAKNGPLLTSLLQARSAQFMGWLAVGSIAFFAWTCLVAIKLLIGVNLRAFASERWATMSDRLGQDVLNDRQRSKIGVTPREETSDRQTKAMLSDDAFYDPRIRKVTLEDLTRFDMVKSRLW
ncbi:hypothetical protein JCM10908_007302 [Rhodotorula pacifica]|uniref:Emp65p n=1 Tax=Rhodotorula pacifica TaxID=1495444 RepID=UPI0031751ED8